MRTFTFSPGAFFVLACLTALQNKLKMPSATNTTTSNLSCGGNCASCTGSVCAANHGILEAEKAAAKAEMIATAKAKAEQAKAAKVAQEKQEEKEDK